MNLERSSTEGELLHLGQSLGPRVLQSVASVVNERKEALVATFYARLMANSEAAPFLSHDIVNERLRYSLCRWLVHLFVRPADDVAAFVAEQRKIGAVHARIRVPIHVVMQGARLLKTEIGHALTGTALDRDELASAIIHVENVIDIAVELMSQAFLRDTTSGARADEAYRAFTLGQDVSLEREIQRAALMEWSQAVLFKLYAGSSDARLPTLAGSEFGLWLQHKGGLLFEDGPTLGRIQATMGHIDDVVMPALVKTGLGNEEERTRLLRDLQNSIGEIKYLLNEMFQAAATLESGRDPLTRALNRRFMPSILSREVRIAARNHAELSILMVDVDHFKQVNDRFGHDAGDVVLRQVAETILAACRASDFVFRYGGEEFLITLVDAGNARALEAAERLRLTIAEKDIRLSDGTQVPVTLSIGIATFNGHPDYGHMISAADQALYRAKRSGRNRCAVATPLDPRDMGMAESLAV